MSNMTNSQILFLSFFSCFWSLNVVTEPFRDSEHQHIIVAVTEGQENITIYCQIREDNVVVEYNWTLYNSTSNTSHLLEFKNGEGNVSDFPFITVVNGTNLTIDQFTVYMNRMQLSCEAGNISETFLFGISEPPSLDLPTIPKLVEGSSVTINLTNLNSTGPFPPYITSYWSYPTTSESITFSDYSITIDPLNRTHSGEYSLIVINEIGSANLSFTLNVLYPPSGIPVDLVTYATVGDNVTMVAFVKFDSNPLPLFKSWRLPNSMSLVKSFNRFNISDDGNELSISSVTEDDFGIYMIILSNYIGESLISQLTLTKAVPPGAPYNVRYQNVTSNSILVIWSPPNTLGNPTLSYYIIEIDSCCTVNTNSTITSFVLEELFPNVHYNITLRGASSYFINGGESSDWINFTTSYGGPAIYFASANSKQGSITFAWDLYHLGGVDISLITIEAHCESVFGILNFSCCSNSCFESNLTGIGSVKPVYSGDIYVCNLTVNNQLESESRMFEVIPIEGIPSSPFVVNITTFMSAITLSLKCQQTGVVNNEDILEFIVILYYAVTGSIAFNKSIPVPNYIAGTIVDLKFTGLSIYGNFCVHLTTRNKFGTSIQTKISLQITPSVTIATRTTYISSSVSSSMELSHTSLFSLQSTPLWSSLDNTNYTDEYDHNIIITAVAINFGIIGLISFVLLMILLSFFVYLLKRQNRSMKVFAAIDY